MNRAWVLMNTLNRISYYITVAYAWLIIAMLLVIAFLVLFPNTNTPLEQPETVPRLVVMDKPLLTPEQRETVLKTDSVAFDVGNEHIVITHGARAALKGYY